VDVLLKLDKSSNPWVRRGAFTIGITIPADQAARLRPLIKKWMPSGFGWRTDPQELVTLVVNLLQGGQYEAGKWFAGLLFSPARTSRSNKPSLTLEEYWYEHELPRVVAALGSDGLSVVLPWLVAYERSEKRFKRDSDLTCIARDVIRGRGDAHPSIEQALIDAVRDLAVEAMLLDAANAKTLLLSAKIVLARKIALFALNEAIKQVADGDDRAEAMLEVGNDLLFDPSSLTSGCRIEYGELARTVASRSAGSLAPLPGFLDAGLRDDSEDLRQWLGRDRADDAEVDGRVEAYKDRQMHLWLSAIGIDALPEQSRMRLAELDSQLGVIESPLEPESRMSMWSGPNSPVTPDEMSVMSPTELMAHLETWHDTGDGWGPEPSHEGQGRELATLLTTTPKALAGVDDLVERLRPRYVRAVLEGWSAALKADLQPDWDQAAAVLQSVLAHSDESSFPAEGGRFDDDADFRPAKQAAVRLLTELAGQRSASTIPADVLAHFADMLINLADDETAWSEYISYEETDMDPLTVSLNWQWPIRVRGLIYLMYHRKDAEWYQAARSALERELARSDTRSASRAVLGEGLGRLLDTDPEWLASKMPLWFGDEHGVAVDQQIALSTATAVHHYHPKLYELLTPSMIAAIGQGENLAAGWHVQSSPLQQIGHWVIDSVIRGYTAVEDDPVAQEFFSSAPAEVRGDALGHIAWTFMHAEVVEEAIRDRFAALWDARVEHVRSHPGDMEELNGFHWFVKSNKFDVEWWLPRLKEAAKLDPQLSSQRYMIGKEIAASADVDPRSAFDVLQLLLQGRDDVEMATYDLTRNAVPLVLARAIASGDSELKREAEDYMNDLGAQGNLSLEAEVNEALSSRMTLGDADG
jgi:hypothetical protein